MWYLLSALWATRIPGQMLSDDPDELGVGLASNEEAVLFGLDEGDYDIKLWQHRVHLHGTEFGGCK